MAEEARDDERGALIETVIEELRESGEVIEINDNEAWMGDPLDRPTLTKFVPLNEVADRLRKALIAADARKHPEPEITEARVEAAARQMHMRAAGYEGRKSWDETTDRIRQGWRDAARDALEAALRVPVGEGEQKPHAAPVAGKRIPGDELIVDSPSYSVRRLLSALDGIETSDEEFSTAAEYVDAGGTITIRDSQGFPLYELRIQGNPTSEEEMPDA